MTSYVPLKISRRAVFESSKDCPQQDSDSHRERRRREARSLKGKMKQGHTSEDFPSKPPPENSSITPLGMENTENDSPGMDSDNNVVRSESSTNTKELFFQRMTRTFEVINIVEVGSKSKE